MIFKSFFPFLVSNTGANGKLEFPKTSLRELMIQRKNLISMDAALKFVKLAFTYEEWSLFESSARQLVHFLQVTSAKTIRLFLFH